jgi:phage shock protein E
MKKMAPNVVVVVVLVLMGAYFLFMRRGDVPGAEAHRLVEQGARLVDVRTRNEFADGHISGALNIPVQELEQRMRELGSSDQSIVVYCRSGARSSRASRMLKSAGYSAVHDLGAMSRW